VESRACGKAVKKTAYKTAAFCDKFTGTALIVVKSVLMFVWSQNGF
jgi:hypothetical protein